MKIELSKRDLELVHAWLGPQTLMDTRAMMVRLGGGYTGGDSRDDAHVKAVDDALAQLFSAVSTILAGDGRWAGEVGASRGVQTSGEL